MVAEKEGAKGDSGFSRMNTDQDQDDFVLSVFISENPWSNLS
jgi:hypothetical protein